MAGDRAGRSGGEEGRVVTCVHCGERSIGRRRNGLCPECYEVANPDPETGDDGYPRCVECGRSTGHVALIRCNEHRVEHARRITYDAMERGRRDRGA